MIRLTLILVGALGVTMMVAGERPDLPQGGYDPDEVARSDNAPIDLVAPVAAAEASTRLPLDDENGALERALSASVSDPVVAEPVIVREANFEVDVPLQETWVVTGSRVNLRAGPSTADAIVDQVVSGQQAEVLDETPDGWMRILVTETDVEGFIYGRFMEPL